MLAANSEAALVALPYFRGIGSSEQISGMNEQVRGRYRLLEYLDAFAVHAPVHRAKLISTADPRPRLGTHRLCMLWLSQRGHQGCRGHVVDKRSVGPVAGLDKTSSHVLA